jgi:hypothetical protein
MKGRGFSVNQRAEPGTPFLCTDARRNMRQVKRCLTA